MATDFTVDRDTVKYVLNSSGDIASVAIDTPAIEYNTDGTYKGLLVEPASTNLCKQSEDFNTSWTPTNATPTQDTEETPDGDTSNKYIKLVDDNTGGGATGQVRVIQSMTVSANTQYTASIFLKADGLAFARLGAFNYDGSTDAAQYFGLSGAGSLGTASNLDDSSIESYPNGWYRCSITWTNGSDPSGFAFGINVAGSISNITVDLDGTSSIFVWGAQVEASPIATSYIPTTTASVTRNKDDISLTGASDLIGQGEGTLYVEVDWRLATGTTQYLFRLQSSTVAGDYAIIRLDDGSDIIRFDLAENGSIKVRDLTQSSDKAGVYKLAFAYDSADSKIGINGTTITPSTNNAFAFTSTLDELFFGTNDGAVQQANMWIRAVALYKTRLTNDQLADLTS
jgi:hypothetical protein